MPYCPECKYEYVEGVAECPDCRLPLVASLDDIQEVEESPERPTGERPICVWDSVAYTESDTACSILRGDQIPCWVERSQRPMHSAYTRDENYPSSYYVMVPESMGAHAREILEGVMPQIEVDMDEDVGELPESEMDEPEGDSEWS